jgi:hypothetical protein
VVPNVLAGRLTNLPWDLSVLTNLKELDLSMNLYTQVIPLDMPVVERGHNAAISTAASYENVSSVILESNRLRAFPR